MWTDSTAAVSLVILKRNMERWGMDLGGLHPRDYQVSGRLAMMVKLSSMFLSAWLADHQNTPRELIALVFLECLTRDQRGTGGFVV